MEEKNHLTAKQASDIADKHNSDLTRIMKSIKKLAKQGRKQLWYGQGISQETKDILLNNGFKVGAGFENQGYTISWEG